MEARRVGKYRLGVELGSGSFATVRQATHVDTDEVFAIKIMRRTHAKELAIKIKTECSVMKILRHPNIVQLKEVMATSKTVYMVLEYCAGGELYDLISEHGAMREPVGRKFFQQLIDAIDFCHRRGVYHRDLKPENLLLSEDKQTLKVADFGMSNVKSETGSKMLRTCVGSELYCAPEIRRAYDYGEEYDGSKVDIWSCGVLLFLFLTGYLPFDSDNPEELAEIVETCNVSYPEEIPKGAVDLLKHMLVKNPAKRYSTSQIKVHPWFRKDFRPVRLMATRHKQLEVQPGFSKVEQASPTSLPNSPQVASYPIADQTWPTGKTSPKDDKPFGVPSPLEGEPAETDAILDNRSGPIPDRKRFEPDEAPPKTYSVAGTLSSSGSNPFYATSEDDAASVARTASASVPDDDVLRREDFPEALSTTSRRRSKKKEAQARAPDSIWRRSDKFDTGGASGGRQGADGSNGLHHTDSDNTDKLRKSMLHLLSGRRFSATPAKPGENDNGSNNTVQNVSDDVEEQQTAHRLSFAGPRSPRTRHGATAAHSRRRSLDAIFTGRRSLEGRKDSDGQQPRPSRRSIENLRSSLTSKTFKANRKGERRLWYRVGRR